MVFLIRKSATASAGEPQASLRDIVETPSPAKVNVAVVSFDECWNEVDYSLTRRLPWPRTTWIFKKGGLDTFILKNGAADRLTVAIVPSLRVDWRNTIDDVRKELKRTFVRWILARGNLTVSFVGEPVSVLPNCIPGTSQRNHTSHDVCDSEPDDSPLLYDNRPHEELGLFKHSTKKTSLTGKVMKIGCVRSKHFEDYDLCSIYSYLLGLLEAKNVSVVYQVTSNWSTALHDFYCENTDMIALRFPFNEYMMAMATYDEIRMVSETFYALAGNMQVPSLSETTLRSASTVAATAASVTICAGLLAFVGGPPLRDRAQSATLFLYAVFLATSRPFPKPRRWPKLQNALCLTWALAMVPLSQYFRCELTSLVTVGLPASNLDTLEELEAAVDAGAVAPCVPTQSATLGSLVYSNHTTTLGKKLRAALLKHRDQLVKDSVRSCLDCARKSDGVCYLPRFPSSLPKLAHVAAFDKNFVTRPSSLPIRKTFPLKDAFRAFLQRVREADLLSSPQCEQKAICTRFSSAEIPSHTEKSLLELRGFFAFYAALLSGTVCVLLAELLFARFSKPAFLRRRRRPWR
ncbi:hypothetical protein MTO96_025826 [Rhipicephalus appendiculatus]